MKQFLALTTLLCAAAMGDADGTPRNSGGRGAATPTDDQKSSVGPIALDSPDLPVGQPITLVFKNGVEKPGFKDPVYGFTDHNGVVFPPDGQPTAWKPVA